ncbi:hypothetical protein MMC28_006341 [Mycoblastus sanguinarius]|nr:hypothetical protein [Mycoblastus sanguinarius]
MAAILEAQMPLTPTSSLGSLKDFEMLPEQEVTRPIEDGSPGEMVNVDAIRTALHVIRTERDALTQLEDLYESDSLAQEGLANAVNVISTTINCGGKLIVSGVGKSSKIGLKVVATMNSFGIRSVFLHPTEALHGDLGLIGDNDSMLIITFSGRTPEILTLLPFLPPALPLIAVTSHMSPSTCAMFRSRPSHLSILLPAPVPVSEVQTFGVAAPTTSTTVALALTDALALSVARRLHPNFSAVFQGYHPGGAIGLDSRSKR